MKIKNNLQRRDAENTEERREKRSLLFSASLCVLRVSALEVKK